jgi:hypothetical protein
VSDLFEEVDEQLRSETYRSLARRYLPSVVAALVLALLVALAVWGYVRYQQGQAEKASDAYAQGLDALTHNDQTAAFNAFQTAAKFSTRGYKSLALMQEAAIRLDQKRNAEAIGLFDQAAQASPDLALGDAARLKAGLALIDTAPYAEVEARLKPLTDSKRPYAPLAREGLAVAKLKAGKTNEARSDFVVLSLMANAPDDVRERAQTAMAMIDSGGVSGLSAIVTAALPLPTPPPAPETQPGQGPPDSQTPEAGAAQ